MIQGLFVLARARLTRFRGNCPKAEEGMMMETTNTEAEHPKEAAIESTRRKAKYVLVAKSAEGAVTVDEFDKMTEVTRHVKDNSLEALVLVRGRRYQTKTQMTVVFQ